MCSTAYRLRVLGVSTENRPLVAEQEIQVDGRDVITVALTFVVGRKNVLIAYLHFSLAFLTVRSYHSRNTVTV